VKVGMFFAARYIKGFVSGVQWQSCENSFCSLKRVVQFSPSKNIVTCCLFHSWFAPLFRVGMEKGMQWGSLSPLCLWNSTGKFPLAANFREAGTQLTNTTFLSFFFCHFPDWWKAWGKFSSLPLFTDAR